MMTFTETFHGSTFNHIVTFQIVQEDDQVDSFVDASLVGLGACWGNVAYSCAIPEDIRTYTRGE